MGSIPRKPVGGVATDETRARNRLSKPKPMSSSRTTTEKLWAATELEHTSTSQLSLLQENERYLSKDESRTHARTHLFETADGAEAKLQPNHKSTRGGVASLVMQFESTASTSQLSVASSVVPQKSLQGIYGAMHSSGSQRQQRVYTISSQDSLRSRQGSTNNFASPSASLDQLSSQYNVPRRRQSNYRPGEATRKPSMHDKENEHPTTRDEVVEGESQQYTVVGDAEASRDLANWRSPPRTGRTDTPTSLDVKAIGGLRLGSLHVVNGRSSPILSELSRQLISRQLRDVSSEYGESETEKESVGEVWEDEEVVDEIESNGPTTPTRATYTADIKGSLTPDRDADTPKPDASSPPHTPTQTSDKTSMLAQAYMSELQGSPFSFDEPSPSSTGSVIHHEQDAQKGSPNSLEQNAKCASGERNFSSGSKQESVDSGISSMRTARARDDIFSSALEYQAPDLQPPPSPERQASPEYLRPESVSKASDKADSGYYSGASMLSLNVVESKLGKMQPPMPTGYSSGNLADTTKEEGPKDASPKKANSPKKLGGFLPTFKRAPATEPVMAPKAVVQPESPVARKAVKPVTKPDSSSRKAKEIKEERREREKEEKKEREREEKKAKAQKKLQKSRPLSKARQPKEIVVQRLPSWESASNIPPVPDTVKDNLKRRSLMVPELERTFRSQDHIRNEPGASALALPLSDIRFPSPRPSTEEDFRSRSAKKGQERPKDRPRSKSRRRSFLDYFKSDRDSDRQGADTAKENTGFSIADFGDVMTSLGSNPYDIAHSRSRSQNPSSRKTSRVPSTQPHDITINRQRPRSSMNDEQASEFARRRSHSFNSRNDTAERRLSFDDRGGLPGKMLRTSLVLDDAPPMPPLPTQEELRRISMRQSLHSSNPNTPSQVRQFWDEGNYSSPAYEPETEPEPENSPPPLPPAHSPRPSFVNQEYESQYEIEDDIELAPPPPSHSPAPIDIRGPPPPPPSHSPRPLNVEHKDQYQNIWEAQAQAWKARRQSAGEALRHHRQPLGANDMEYGNDDEQVIDDFEETNYPAIPPRHPGRRDWEHHSPSNLDQGTGDRDTFYQAGQVHRSQTWNDGSYDQYHDDYSSAHTIQPFEASPLRRNQTWDDSQEYLSAYGSTYFYKQRHQGSRQSGHISRGSNDSRQSFYSHHNCPIDRPFDPPPQVLEDFDDDYDHPNEYYTPRSSPVRGRGPQQANYGYDNHYEAEYQYHGYQPNHHQRDFHSPGRTNHHHVTQSPTRSAYGQQQSHQDYQSQSPQPSPTRSHRNSLAPPSPSPSRPESRQSRHSLLSMRSNGSAVSLAEELHPEIDQRPSLAPEFGRYSGGLGYGYEGRKTGFGGSAGTRTASGKADAMWKGTELRGSFGVDLGDIPVIGVVKKLPG